MATYGFLKHALGQKANETAAGASSTEKQLFSRAQYAIARLDPRVKSPLWTAYSKFAVPQLSQLLTSLVNNSHVHNNISVLEIESGRFSALGRLPGHLKRRIRRYTAFAPNQELATSLEKWLCPEKTESSPFACLEKGPDIHQMPFGVEDNPNDGEKYDFVLFCHSTYGVKRKCIERALGMLSQDGMVVVFNETGLHIDGLVCHRTATFPIGMVCVPDDDKTLDYFASYAAGFVMLDVDVDKAVRVEWRKVCRALGRRDEAHPNHLCFGIASVMQVFTQHATELPELTAQVPLVKWDNTMGESWEARQYQPASIVRPTEIRHVQQCVQWALKYEFGLTVVGGGHSGHCFRPNVVSVDMSGFTQVHIVKNGEDSSPLVIAEAGCKTKDIVRKTIAAGVTVPLGSGPSVGAGLWLQGGIGHLARLHGLTSDAIVGAIVVSVDSGEILCVGRVPSQHQPVDAVRPKNESDLLWAIKGAGTNFGIVISVTFEAFAAPTTYLTRTWVVPLSDNFKAQLMLHNVDNLIGKKLPRDCSADTYLYWDADQLHLGVTMFESTTTAHNLTTPTPTAERVRYILGPEKDSKVVDGVGLFETDMYVSEMHGGHGGGKTSSFKRCLFLKHIGEWKLAGRLIAAIDTRPTPLCYLHLLQGGGAVGDIAPDATAFGCRDWDFACVITGVWTPDQDGTEIERSVVRWVYKVAEDLMSSSTGAYGADLGPDPRDAALAAKAFGSNWPRLARLKHILDPHNVLAYACPLPKVKPKLIILVTGESFAGKDYCADVWVSVFNECTDKSLAARAVSISDATKREYAAATGADLNLLLSERAYKEQHRPALTKFFQEQVQQRPQLPEERFLDVVYGAVDVDVLLITGMRDEAPSATFSHLVPDCRLIEVHVQASERMRRIRRGEEDVENKKCKSNPKALDYRPSFIFDNDTSKDKAAKEFAKNHLLPFVHDDLQRLDSMVRQQFNFPDPGIEFRHILGIPQQPGGRKLCTSLLESHFSGDWTKVDAVVSCEAGGYVFASALAERVDVDRLVLIRKAGKLPPPTISVTMSPSHISSLGDSKEKQIEMERDVIPGGSSVVVVDDVLATGETLCAVLQLLNEAGISNEKISVMVVAEFPVHRGRALLSQRGFGKVNVQSLLVFGGA